MPYDMTLTPALVDQVIDELSVAFSGGPVFFDSLVPNLKLAVASFVSSKFVVTNVKLFSDRYYPQANYTSAEQKAELEQIRLIFGTCFILLFSKHEAARARFSPAHTANDMLQRYKRHDPELFTLASTSDAEDYVHFRNIVEAALLVVPTKLKKRLIVDAACRLMSPPRVYTWGKSMSMELRRLVAIYHIVSGVPVEKRTPRQRSVQKPRQSEIASANRNPAKRGVHAVNESSSDSEDEERRDRKAPRVYLLPTPTTSTVPVNQVVDPTTQFGMADFCHASEGSTASDLLRPLVAQGGRDQCAQYFIAMFPETDKSATLSEMFNFHPDYSNGLVN